MVAWTDSALYNSYDETGLDTDEQLKAVEKKLVRSQHGCLAAVVDAARMDEMGPVPVSALDWASHASRRVVTSTFAAETSAAMEALGRAVYLRALLAEIMFGKRRRPHEWTEEDMKVILVTDCKSLYDNIQKDCSLCEDRQTALYICALRQVTSAGPQRDASRAALVWVPSRHQLADGLTKAGLGDLVRTMMATGTCHFHEESAQALRRKKKA